jgi:signal peptidase II
MVLFELTVGILLAGLTAYALLAKRLAAAEVVATALIVGGGAGNLIDRLYLGYVRDFANLGLGRLRTGVFNVADLAIMAGFAVLIVYLVRTRSTGAPSEG